MADFVLLAPAFLGLIVLAAVVALLHQAYQRRMVSVSSLIVWRRLQTLRQQAMPGRRWPRPNVAMLLQIAALVLIALALARPLIGSDPAVPIHKIYVLDASGSMRAADGNGTRFDTASTRLADLLARDIDPDGPRVSLLLAGPVPQLLLARQRDDHDLLADQASKLQPGDGAVDWDAVARMIAAVRRDGENDQLIILSDGADAAMTAMSGIATTQIRVGSAIANAGLEARLEPSASGSDQVRLTGTVHFSGGEHQAELTVWFQSDATTQPLQLASQIIAAPAPDGIEVGFDIDDLAIVGGGVLSARLSDDAQPSDNASNFLIDASPPSLDILLVGPPQPQLLKALQSLAGAIVRPVDSLPADVSGYGLAVINDVAVERQPETNTLWIAHGRIAGTAEPAALAPGEITAWRLDHPLSRGIVWSGLDLTRAVRIAPWPDGDIVLAAGDTPLIEARSSAFGREVAIAFDPAEDWSSQTTFPQFLGNLIDWLGVSHEGRLRAPCVVGTPCAIDARWSGTLSSLPDGQTTLALPYAGGTFVASRAGLYQHVEGQNATLLAVNPDWRESVSLNATQAAPAVTSPAPAPVRLWPWLLSVAALVLCLEAWTAWRAKSAPRWLLPSRAGILILLLAAFLNLPGPWLADADRTVIVASAPLALAGDYPAPVAGPAMVVTGDTAMVTGDFDDTIAPPAVSVTPWGTTQDGLRLAAAMLPSGQANHIVLASGTAVPSPAIADLLPLLADRNIVVDVAPNESQPPGEVAMTGVEGPPALFIGDSFRLIGRVRAGSAMQAHLQVSQNGMQIAEQDIALTQGDNPIDIAIPKAKQGDVFYEMSVTAAGDGLPQNNTNGTWVKAIRSPRILVLSADQVAGEDLRAGLAAQGLNAQLKVPTAAPWLLKDWLAYDGYVLADVPAIALNPTQQALLEQAVSQHGRTLLMLGGPHSFGPGGYLETPLDRLSPLSSRVPKPAPEAALVFVLDRSGSMSQLVGDIDRLEVAKQATLSAISLLNPESQVGIIAFDTEPHIILPLQPVSQIGNIRAALQSLGSGGGTDLQPALAAALDQLRGAHYPLKHIVALTDGLTPPTDYAPLLSAIKAEGASVSTIAIGTGSNMSTLRDIAAGGGGVFHASNDFRALPSILSQETMLMSDTAIEERLTTPQWVGPRPQFMGGLPETLPQVSGYVLTTEKPDANVDMTVVTEDGGTSPLLGWWQYGSGTVLALTTQAYGPWTSNWLAMQGYGAFWPEVLRHFMSGADAPGLALHLTRSGDGVEIVATALDAARQPRMGLELTAAVIAEQGGKRTDVQLHETQPGLYEGTRQLDAIGDYRITVANGRDAAEATFHLAFPARLAFERGVDNSRLAALSGGMVIPGGDPLPLHPASKQITLNPNWIFWALCAIAAFMIELFARYGSGLFQRSGSGTKAGAMLEHGRGAAKTAPLHHREYTGGN